MKRIIFSFFFSVSLFGISFAQNEEIKSFLEEGIKLHDKGDYEGAIEQYKKVLKIDSQSPAANYEISSSYFAMQNYKKAIEHSDKVIDAKSQYVDQAYILKGSAQDVQGEPKDAIKTYKKGIKEFPDSYLLHYNLAYTYYNQKELKEAEKELQQTLAIKPSHPSSHILLGFLMSDQGFRVQALLALYNFLLLEPEGKRAKAAYSLLDSELKKGVRKDGSNTINITMDKNSGSDEFRAAELMLSLLEASKSLEKNEGKTEMDLFIDNTKSFFSVLGELKKDNKGFWWNFYVDYFNSLKENNHVDTFCYYILQSKGDEKIFDWLKNNSTKIESFSNWNKNYKRK